MVIFHHGDEAKDKGLETMKALNMTLQKHNDYGKMALDTIFDKLRENRGEKEEKLILLI